MRNYYDETGRLIRSVCIPFEEIPEDYMIKQIHLTYMQDLSYLGVMKKLSDSNIEYKNAKEKNEAAFGASILSYLAFDYLKSAIALHEKIIADRTKAGLTVSLYLIPCVFCCRHAIELKLKQCIYVVSEEILSTHSIIDLWNRITIKKHGIGINKLSSFIKDVNEMDKNEIVMRYGLDTKLKQLDEDYLIDIDALIQNT